MKNNPLLALEALGQSVWMDYIRRGLILSGDLQRLITQDGVSGVTSNPSIFEKAIAESPDYNDQIHSLVEQKATNAEIFESLAIGDIQNVADLLRPTFDNTHGRDGFVSLEVSPKLAFDTRGTIVEARRLWSKVDRPNLMIKVPATTAGLPAIRQLVGEGLNINITLLFGLPRYREVADAYLGGLETLASNRKPLARAASVASFFLSRIDVLIDPKLEQKVAAGGPQARQASDLHGQVAIASAKAAYQIYKEIFSSERFKKLAGQGARTQKLLWASTSTKNPTYSDIKYVEPLIAPDTINTLPLETINAYRDHGLPGLRLDQDVDKAQQVLDALPAVGINIDEITQQLEDEGVEKFDRAFDNLYVAIDEKLIAALAGHH